MGEGETERLRDEETK